MVYARALVAATKAATADRDPGPLQAALDEALGAEMPAKCAAAVKARKLLRKLNKQKAQQEQEAEAARAAAAKQKADQKEEAAAAKVSKCCFHIFPGSSSDAVNAFTITTININA